MSKNAFFKHELQLHDTRKEQRDEARSTATHPANRRSSRPAPPCSLFCALHLPPPLNAAMPAEKLPIRLPLIKVMFLVGGFVMHVCSSFRRAFLVNKFAFKNTEFALFMAFSYPISFLAGLLWSNLHRKSSSQFRCLTVASVAACVFFMATAITGFSRLATALCMFGYVASMAAIMPITCILCFQSLKDRTFFGQNFILALGGTVVMPPIVRYVCGMREGGVAASWAPLYALALLMHVFYVGVLRLISHWHATDEDAVCFKENIYLSDVNRSAAEDESAGDAADIPIYFTNTPYSTDMAGSSFSRGSPLSSSVSSASIKKRSRLRRTLSSSVFGADSLLNNTRFMAIVLCGFMVSISTHMMKILLPSFLEDFVKVGGTVESLVASVASAAELAAIVAFPYVAREFSYAAIFLASVSFYFAHMTSYLLLPGLCVRIVERAQIATLFLLFAPLKGLAAGLLQCTAPILISAVTPKRSNGQRLYSAVVSMLAGFVAGIFGYAISEDAMPSTRPGAVLSPVNSGLVFRHCFGWSFVALLFAFYIFVVKRPGHARSYDFKYEALFIDNMYAD